MSRYVREKALMVVENNRGIKYPRSVPRPRKSHHIYITYTTLCLLIIAGLVLNPSFVHLSFLASMAGFLSITMEIIKRIAMWINENEHLHTRYKGSYKELFSDCFSFNWGFQGLLVLCIVVAFLTSEHWKDCSNTDLSIVFIVFAVYRMTLHLNLHECPLDTSISFMNMKDLGLGTGFAYSYYQGYLKIMLPRENNGFLERMKIYECTHRIHFAQYMLFLLIPLSCYCPPRLTDHSEIMQESQSLGIIETDRAGIPNRNYKNAVYKIEWNGGFIYVCAEYASPLKTMLELNELSPIYKKLRKEICWQFYQTIVRLIKNDENMRGLVECIYFDDKDSEGNIVDVGNVLLQKLEIDESDIKMHKNERL